MDLDLGFCLNQEQKLKMTQQMQLSLKLLRMSSIELQQYAENELQENPLLEAKSETTENIQIYKNTQYKELVRRNNLDNYNQYNHENFEDLPILFNSLSKINFISEFNYISDKKTLSQFLYDQISDLNENVLIKFVCEYIVDNIDEKGYLDMTVENLGSILQIDIEVIKYSMDLVHGFEPDGIAASNIGECLKIQLHKKDIYNKDLEYIIDNYLINIAESKYTQIAEDLNISPKEAQYLGDIIRTLEPKPSRGFYTGDNIKYITPDAYLNKIGNEYLITMNEDILPKLSINSEYKEVIYSSKEELTIKYIREKVNSAMFVIKSIDKRKSTIYKVLEKIIHIQEDYFSLGVSYLKPMTLNEIAAELNVHASTVSRAIREKYLYTSRGIILIKDLFTTGISSLKLDEDISAKKIKSRIRVFIEKEDKSKPYSDQQICHFLIIPI